jgi:hypothetical protein
MCCFFITRTQRIARNIGRPVAIHVWRYEQPEKKTYLQLLTCSIAKILVWYQLLLESKNFKINFDNNISRSGCTDNLNSFSTEAIITLVHVERYMPKIVATIHVDPFLLLLLECCSTHTKIIIVITNSINCVLQIICSTQRI